MFAKDVFTTKAYTCRTSRVTATQDPGSDASTAAPPSKGKRNTANTVSVTRVAPVSHHRPQSRAHPTTQWALPYCKPDSRAKVIGSVHTAVLSRSAKSRWLRHLLTAFASISINTREGRIVHRWNVRSAQNRSVRRNIATLEITNVGTNWQETIPSSTSTQRAAET